MQEVKLLSNPSLKNLEKEVNDYLKKGYELKTMYAAKDVYMDGDVHVAVMVK